MTSAARTPPKVWQYLILINGHNYIMAMWFNLVRDQSKLLINNVCFNSYLELDYLDSMTASQGMTMHGVNMNLTSDTDSSQYVFDLSCITPISQMWKIMETIFPPIRYWFVPSIVFDDGRWHGRERERRYTFIFQMTVAVINIHACFMSMCSENWYFFLYILQIHYQAPWKEIPGPCKTTT